ncbi:MAG TPA: ACP S-malonyltransferase, partial [Bryobacteraceae bacterium]|nr:ACP S-malonyltransferase [Bryobacteraceae bacterium]
MQKAVPKGVDAMAAILKLPEGKLDSILAEAAQGEVVSAANFNSPDQIVIAGHAGAVSRAANLAKAAGAKRAVMLPVSAPFHCPLMKPAEEQMKAELDACEFRDLQVPLINNVAARVVRTGPEARQGLVHQISGAVRWAQSMRAMIVLGVTDAIEAGPGSVLSGLMKAIDPAVQMKKFGEASDLEKLDAAAV